MNLTSLITATTLLLSLLGCGGTTPTPSNKSDSHRYTQSASIDYHKAIRHYEREYPKTSLIHQLATNSKLKSTPHFPKRWIILEDGDLIHRYDGKSSLAFQEFRDALYEELRKTDVQLAKRNIVLTPSAMHTNPVASECDLSGTQYNYILLVDMKIQNDTLRISFRAEDVKKNANVDKINISPIEIPLADPAALHEQLNNYQADNSYRGYAYNPLSFNHTGWISTTLTKNINCIAQSQDLDIQDSRVYFDRGDIPSYSYEDDIIEDTKAKLMGSGVRFVEKAADNTLKITFIKRDNNNSSSIRASGEKLYTEIYFKATKEELERYYAKKKRAVVASAKGRDKTEAKKKAEKTIKEGFISRLHDHLPASKKYISADSFELVGDVELYTQKDDTGVFVIDGLFFHSVADKYNKKALSSVETFERAHNKYNPSKRTKYRFDLLQGKFNEAQAYCYISDFLDKPIEIHSDFFNFFNIEKAILQLPQKQQEIINKVEYPKSTLIADNKSINLKVFYKTPYDKRIKEINSSKVETFKLNADYDYFAKADRVAYIVMINSFQDAHGETRHHIIPFGDRFTKKISTKKDKIISLCTSNMQNGAEMIQFFAFERDVDRQIREMIIGNKKSPVTIKTDAIHTIAYPLYLVDISKIQRLRKGFDTHSGADEVQLRFIQQGEK